MGVIELNPSETRHLPVSKYTQVMADNSQCQAHELLQIFVKRFVQDPFILPESKDTGSGGGGEYLKYSMVPRPTQRILKL